MRGFLILSSILSALVIWLFAAAPDVGAAGHPAVAAATIEKG